MKIIPSILLIFVSYINQAHAFPELIRHNYVNCTSCHVSPNGGGVLNEYGRETSVAALSTWGTEDEAKPFYNLLKQPDWDKTAIVRAVQTFKNNSKVSSGYFWWMEGDLEAAAHFGEKKAWTADLAIGASPDMMNGLLAEGQFPVVSRRHYLMYRPTEATSIRAGKFLTDYGIYFSEHSIATRQGIGFDQGNETYNLEYSYQGESWSGSLTAVLGRPDDSSLLMEKGFAASGGIHLLDHHKIGWSAYYGTLNGTSRELTGPFLLLGFTPHFYFTGESDLQWMQPKNQSATQGVFSYGRLGYEVIQGVHIYLMTQNSTHAFSGTPQALAPQAKYGNLINRMTGFGPGVIWYPRPHFYVKFELQNQISSELPSGQTSGYLTGNIYL